MVGPLQMFDIAPINAGMAAGMQRGAVNSPFTALGTALKGTLDRYQKSLDAAKAHTNEMELQKLKNEGAWGMYGLPGSPFGQPGQAGQNNPVTYTDPDSGKQFVQEVSTGYKGTPVINWKPVTQDKPEDPLDAYMRTILEPKLNGGKPTPGDARPIGAGVKGAVPAATGSGLSPRDQELLDTIRMLKQSQ